MSLTMKVGERLRIWWRGVSPSATELENGGYRLTYQNPNYRTPRDRFLTAVRAPFTKWLFGPVITGLVIGVAVLAIGTWLKWLGLV